MDICCSPLLRLLIQHKKVHHSWFPCAVYVHLLIFEIPFFSKFECDAVAVWSERMSSVLLPAEVRKRGTRNTQQCVLWLNGKKNLSWNVMQNVANKSSNGKAEMKQAGTKNPNTMDRKFGSSTLPTDAERVRKEFILRQLLLLLLHPKTVTIPASFTDEEKISIENIKSTIGVYQSSLWSHR